jgi:outer membrane protein OmpA-like peptidoglycan-associated protein
MLLASAPRLTRARWLGVSTLVLAMALAAPATVHGQDGTVYIGGGSNSQDGARGVQGGDNVIVNLDAIDGGRGRARSGNRNTGNRSPGNGNQPSVEFGEPYRGPAGAMLRFPPERPPQSQLVVDPDQLPDSRQASRDTQQADPAPGRKPAQRQPQDAGRDPDRQRTAAATPATKPDTPSATQTGPSDSSADLPETPSFDGAGRSRDETRTSRQSQPDTPMRDTDDGSAPTELTVRPTRKPEPPQATQMAEPQDSAPRDTETASTDATDTQPRETAAMTESAQPSEPAVEPTSDAAPEARDAAPEASEPEPAPQSSSEPTQTAATDPESNTQPGDDGQMREADAPAAPDSTDADTQQTATRTEPDSDATTDAPTTASAGTDASGTDATGADATGETQTASLPPEALPDQMRLMFEDGSASLSDSAKSRLDQLAGVLEENPQQRVQLMAFAQGTEETASQARRLSLSRALAVRTYLIDQGIRSTRMDVRALGATADQGPLDRVDIVPANR